MPDKNIQVSGEELARVQKMMLGADDAILLALKGEVLMDGDGNPVMEDGKLVRIPPSASIIKAALVRCKDAGVSKPLKASDPLDEMRRLAEQQARRTTGALPPINFREAQ